VRAGPVGRHHAGRGREGDIGAADRRVDGRKPAARQLARRAQALLERILAAGVEEDERDARVALHLLEHDREIERLEVDITVAVDIGADRQNPVLALGLERVTRIVEEARVGAVGPGAEAAHGLLERRAVGIENEINLEAEALECRRRVAGIVEGMRQRGRVGVVGGADHQRDAPLGRLEGGGGAPDVDEAGQKDDGRAGTGAARVCGERSDHVPPPFPWAMRRRPGPYLEEFR
jgi:hypothetical protein